LNLGLAAAQTERNVAVQTTDGFRLTIDRGPNWLFVKLRPRARFARDIPLIADQLWSVASRHFIYRVVLELEELDTLPANMIEQLVLLQERLAGCGGALRICGLSNECVEVLREHHLEAALPNHATRQAAVLGGDLMELRARLKQIISDAAADDSDPALAAFAPRHEPCLQ